MAASKKALDTAEEAFDNVCRKLPEGRMQKYLFSSSTAVDKATNCPSVKSAHFLKAVINLYLLTRDEKYLMHIQSLKAQCDAILETGLGKVSQLLFVELDLFGGEVEALAQLRQKYRNMVTEIADSGVSCMEQMPYRALWMHPDAHPKGLWRTNPVCSARSLSLAWKMTGNEKYRNAALQVMDWNAGANPNGMSYTSGIGYRYPAFASFPTPEKAAMGISVFFNRLALDSGNIAILPAKAKDGVDAGQMAVLIPLFGEKEHKTIQMREALCLLEKALPVCHRINGSYSPSYLQSPSLHEAQGAAASIIAFLLPEGSMLSDSIVNKKVMGSFKLQEGYAPLP